jgi:biotin carboxylase
LIKSFNEAPDVKRVLFLSPTRRELNNLVPMAKKLGYELIFDEFDNHYLDNFLGENPDLSQPPLDIVSLIDLTVAKHRNEHLDGVTAAIGYPGMSAVSVLSKNFGLVGPGPESIMVCEHKYYSRMRQKQFVPEATPEFQLLDPEKFDIESVSGFTFPAFMKPVKSCMSKNAHVVLDADHLARLAENALLPNQFISPFNDLLSHYTDLPLSANYLLLEGLLKGSQVSLEGYVFDNKVVVMGVVDAVMFPGTLAFKRWQYPSQLPIEVLNRMVDIAARFFKGIGYNNALFNMELFYDSESDQVSIIEINPKIASQFPGLFDRVDGFSTYQTLLEVATGQVPNTKFRQGKFALAASCVLRVFEDKLVKSVPSQSDIDAVQKRFPDSQVQIYIKSGQKLSDLVQDTVSYRYGLIDIGANSAAELEEKFEICKSMLNFDFAPLPELASGKII